MLVTCPNGHQYDPRSDAADGRPRACPLCNLSRAVPATQVSPVTPMELGQAASETAGAATMAVATMAIATGLATDLLPGQGDVPAALPPTVDGEPPTQDEIPSPQRGKERPSVAGYELLGELGRGGMGVVYKARQLSLNRIVALKMILSGAHASPRELARFRTEAEAVARLQHPNIVQIHEIGEQEGRPYFSLEFLDGGSLEGKADGKPLPPRYAAQIMEPVARAMHFAHQRNIIHRDLKPGNILLTTDGVPKVSDFGLAKHMDSQAGMTKSGTVVGTPNYMAPEQAWGKTHELGPLTDVYALGALLYELLTGRPPFIAETPVDTLMMVIKNEPVPPTRLQPKVPRDLETICLKCLEKETHRRYGSAEALADDLRRFLTGEPINARPTKAWERVIKWAKRRPAAAALIGISTAAALSLMIVSLWFNWRLTSLNQDLAKERDEVVTQKGNVETKAKEAQEQRVAAEDNRQKAEDREGEAKKQQTLAELSAKEAKEQRDLAEAYAKEANAQRIQALTNLQKARNATNRFLTEVGHEILEDVPGLSEEKRHKLLQDALAFYEELAKEDPKDPTHRGEIALAHYRVGLLRMGLGAYPAAMSDYLKAIALQEPLASEFPLDARHWRDLANSRNYLGLTLSRSGGRSEQAEGQYRQAIQLQERLAAAAPGAPSYRQELARSYYNLGIVQMESSRHPAAESNYDKAVELLTTLRKEQPTDPEYANELARSYLNRGVNRRNSGRLPEAEADYTTAIGLFQELHERREEVPFKPDYRLNLAVGYLDRGNLRLNEQAVLFPDKRDPKRLTQAEEDLRTALPLFATVAEDFPGRHRYRFKLANCHGSLAVVLKFVAGAKKDKEADALYDAVERHYRAALQIHTRLADKHEEVADYQSALGGTLDNLAVLLRDRNHVPEARQYLERARPRHLAARKANDQQPTYRQLLCFHHVARAETFLKEKDHAQAAKEAAELPRVSPEGWQELYQAAHLLAQCATLADKEKSSSAQAYSDQAVQLLQQAVQNGYANLQQLQTMRTFDILRKRPDFKKLESELQRKTLGERP